MDALKMIAYLIGSLFAVVTTIVVAIGGAILWMIVKTIAGIAILTTLGALALKEYFERDK